MNRVTLQITRASGTVVKSDVNLPRVPCVGESFRVYLDRGTQDERSAYFTVNKVEFVCYENEELNFLKTVVYCNEFF
jgi:hypothetical protein